MNATRTRVRFAGIAVVAGLSLAACGGSSGGTVAETASDAASAAASVAPGTEEATTKENFGAGCAAVPADGKGSFSGMVADPVATAASNNPVLSTLVTAVGAAGLGDTLNGAKDITVFAPANSAFDKIPADALNGLIADVPALTAVLTYHVVGQKLTPADLATGGPFKTLNGGEVTTAGSGESFTVGADKANIVCGNVQTANATVYIIDSVLTPPAS